MLTLDVLDSIQLSKVPWGQVLMGYAVLAPNYNFPLRRTKIELEGVENIPGDRPVIFAMNHTDRYNYWPFQYRLWRQLNQFTTTWVKGKYYNQAALRTFMIKTNNLAVPSRGYLITADAAQVLGQPPKDKTYRLIRSAIDAQSTDIVALREEAAEAGVLAELSTLIDTPRNMLGFDFHPQRQNYLEAQRDLFQQLMEKFVELNEQAFGLGLNIIVFPEGTRAVRLQEGKPGLAQMALRMKATVVPVGSNGSDRAYPGNSPLSKGGHLIYRIGKPLTPDGELKEFQIQEHFTPFTHEAEEKFGEKFQGMTDLVMSRIEELLDERHRPAEGEEGGTKGASRFL